MILGRTSGAVLDGTYAGCVSAALTEPIGVVLAGGAGRRLGGSKAIAQLGGRPLISYPLQALRGAVHDVAVVAKAGTALPPLHGVAVWREPDEPRHPLTGIVEALARAGGRPVLICAADLPFVTPAALVALIRADAHGAPAVIAAGPDGSLQPLLGRYLAPAASLLAPAAREAILPVRAAVAAIGPRIVDLGDPELLFNVNSPQDLRAAEIRLATRT